MQGRVQRKGAVMHLIANLFMDLSAELAGSAAQKGNFPLPHGRGDEVHQGGSRHDARDLPDPHGRIDQLRVKPQDFR